jgi:hypothetical protein
VVTYHPIFLTYQTGIDTVFFYVPRFSNHHVL